LLKSVSLSFRGSPYVGYASKPSESMHVFEPKLGQNVNSISVFGHVHFIAKIKTEIIIKILWESELPPVKPLKEKTHNDKILWTNSSAKLK